MFSTLEFFQLLPKCIDTYVLSNCLYHAREGTLFQLSLLCNREDWFWQRACLWLGKMDWWVHRDSSSIATFHSPCELSFSIPVPEFYSNCLSSLKIHCSFLHFFTPFIINSLFSLVAEQVLPYIWQEQSVDESKEGLYLILWPPGLLRTNPSVSDCWKCNDLIYSHHFQLLQWIMCLGRFPIYWEFIALIGMPKKSIEN